MIIILKQGTQKSEADIILHKIEQAGLRPLYMPGTERTVLGAIGDERILVSLHLENYPCVDRITPVLTPYKLVSREAHRADSVISIGNHPIGGEVFTIIAGPCAIESSEQIHASASAVKASGAHILRAGAYKPRSSPYSFQGLEKEGLCLLKEASERTQLPSVTEIMDVADIDIVSTYATALQIGARNMQNFRLLKAVGKTNKPVILKRGMSAYIEELLMAAEYIVAAGNPHVILCERGIRTFETATRNTLDLNAIPYIKEHSHLPVLVDPSHGTGNKQYVTPMAKAAIACGADGLMIEVHSNPVEALSDGPQSLNPSEFQLFMDEITPFIRAAGKKLVT